ncbi:MAG TPA: porin [Burkholderiaceae bacterium]|nr:porin [Burkholderiaceae bacterium]
MNDYVFIGEAKVGLGLIERKTHTATDVTADLHYLGLSYPFADNWVLDTQVARFNEKDLDDGKSTQFVARATYKFSKRTAVYVSAGHIRNEDNARISISPNPGPANVATGENQSGVMTGIRHSF